MGRKHRSWENLDRNIAHNGTEIHPGNPAVECPALLECCAAHFGAVLQPKMEWEDDNSFLLENTL
jgi:hypothetical protein